MRVQMLISISGYRNEEPWPPVGGVIELPDHEAESLLAAGYALAAPPETVEETTDAVDTADSDEPAAEDGDSADAADGDEAADNDSEPVAPAPSRRRRQA